MRTGAWTRYEVAELRRLAGDGKQDKEIARSLDRTYTSVWQKRKAIGLKPIRRHYTAFDVSACAMKAAKENLAFEIAAARAERRTAPLYRPAWEKISP